MRKIFTLLFICSLYWYAPAQCVLPGLFSNPIAQSQVYSCLDDCGCQTIEITGEAEIGFGDWNLVPRGDLTIIIRTGGSLVFIGTMTMASEIFLSEGSEIIIEDTGPGSQALKNNGNRNNLRIFFGDVSYDGHDFDEIIDAGGVNINGVLPVELTKFEARSKNDMVELSWRTASEQNNDYFEVEHSFDGITFNVAGKVRGQGTTTIPVDYAFLHRQPVIGNNYYRLKQVDYDGVFAYTDVVVVNMDPRTDGVLIYPNPTGSQVVISIGDRPEKINFRLTDMMGLGLDLQPALVNAGWQLDLSELPNGIYMVRMDYNGKTITKRIIKN